MPRDNFFNLARDIFEVGTLFQKQIITLFAAAVSINFFPERTGWFHNFSQFDSWNHSQFLFWAKYQNNRHFTSVSCETNQKKVGFFFKTVILAIFCQKGLLFVKIPIEIYLIQWTRSTVHFIQALKLDFVFCRFCETALILTVFFENVYTLKSKNQEKHHLMRVFLILKVCTACKSHPFVKKNAFTKHILTRCKKKKLY